MSKSLIRNRLHESLFTETPLKIAYCLYVIKANGLHKIGITSQPRKRLAGFKSTLPCSVEVVICQTVTHHRYVESELHKRFSSKRANGEWFDLVPGDIETIALYLQGFIYSTL